MAYADVWFQSADGLKLHARDHAGAGDHMPVLCLSGLTRNVRDFEPVADLVGTGRRIVAMDYRGRGQSQYADDPQAYRPDFEAADAFLLLDTLGISRAAIIGTSRGGIVAMVMAAQNRDRLAGILFNDIGPVLGKQGLLRIRSYLGKSASFAGWRDAVVALKRTHDAFRGLSEEDWLAFAHRVYREENGNPALDYDLRLGETFPTAEEIEAGPLPDLWALFDGLDGLPLSVLRGDHSDLLSADTVAEMQRRHPGLEATAIPDRGHVPFLDEPESVAAIRRWLARVDAAG
ncbi:alpha/beta hydrolase [soil metagenome]